VLTPLLAPLLEEAPYSGAIRVLRIPTPISNLELLELDYSSNISINSTSYK
jgi:hypothetical protein